MLINLDGWPRVGKLTVGRVLAMALGGRLLDNHTLLNVADVRHRGVRGLFDYQTSGRHLPI
jgi:shikimate kinase